MKRTLGLIAFLSIPCLQADADFVLRPSDMLAITGDSITAQHYYSALLEDYLLMCQPTPHLSAAQFGWAGETAPGFLARVDSDLYPFKPTVVTTCYGMKGGAGDSHSAHDPNSAGSLTEKTAWHPNGPPATDAPTVNTHRRG